AAWEVAGAGGGGAVAVAEGAAADQLPDQGELAGRCPRLLGGPPAQHADDLVVGGALAPSARARQLLEYPAKASAWRAGIPGTALAEVAKPQARVGLTTAASRPGVAGGVFALPGTGIRLL